MLELFLVRYFEPKEEVIEVKDRVEGVEVRNSGDESGEVTLRR